MRRWVQIWIWGDCLHPDGNIQEAVRNLGPWPGMSSSTVGHMGIWIYNPSVRREEELEYLKWHESQAKGLCGQAAVWDRGARTVGPGRTDLRFLPLPLLSAFLLLTCICPLREPRGPRGSKLKVTLCFLKQLTLNLFHVLSSFKLWGQNYLELITISPITCVLSLFSRLIT